MAFQSPQQPRPSETPTEVEQGLPKTRTRVLIGMGIAVASAIVVATVIWFVLDQRAADKRAQTANELRSAIERAEATPADQTSEVIREVEAALRAADAKRSQVPIALVEQAEALRPKLFTAQRTECESEASALEQKTGIGLNGVTADDLRKQAAQVEQGLAGLSTRVEALPSTWNADLKRRVANVEQRLKGAKLRADKLESEEASKAKMAQDDAQRLAERESLFQKDPAESFTQYANRFFSALDEFGRAHPIPGSGGSFRVSLDSKEYSFNVAKTDSLTTPFVGRTEARLRVETPKHGACVLTFTFRFRGGTDGFGRKGWSVADVDTNYAERIKLAGAAGASATSHEVQAISDTAKNLAEGGFKSLWAVSDEKASR